jgi:hypothetical protein
MKISRIIIGLILLFALCAGAQFTRPYPELADILAQPEKYAGKRVAIFIEAQITKQTEEGFILTQRGDQVAVHSNIKDAPINEFVTVAGIFQPPNHIHADTVHLAKGRRWKIAVSIIPVLALTFLLPMALSFDRRTRTFILRPTKNA